MKHVKYVYVKIQYGLDYLYLCSGLILGWAYFIRAKVPSGKLVKKDGV